MAFGTQGQGSTIEYTRPDGSVLRPMVIERGTFGKTQTHKSLREPVVDPQGHVIAAEICTWLDKPGIRLVVQHEGQIMLTKHAKDLGMVLYRDMCFGHVPGVEASPVHWKIYLAVSALKAKNQVPDHGALPPEKLYHPEVIRRRKADSGGVRRISVDEIESILEGIRSQATGDEETARAAAEERGMVVPDNDGDEELRALLEKVAADGN